MEVHGFLAGDLQRVVNTQAGRFRRIDPPGESRKPLRNRQRIIVDDIVDTRLGSTQRLEQLEARMDKIVDQVDRVPYARNSPDEAERYTN